MTFKLSNEDIEEIVLDVFFIVWNNREKLQDDLFIEPYIIGVTKNVIKNKYRTICSNYNIDDYDSIIEDPIDIQLLIEQQEKNKIIKSALDTMKEQDKEIFILFYYNSLSIKEISIKLSITENNVKTKLHRIRKKIKKFLIQGGYSYGK